MLTNVDMLCYDTRALGSFDEPRCITASWTRMLTVRTSSSFPCLVAPYQQVDPVQAQRAYASTPKCCVCKARIRLRLRLGDHSQTVSQSLIVGRLGVQPQLFRLVDNKPRARRSLLLAMPYFTGGMPVSS